MLLSHEFPWNHLAWADHERHSGDVPTWRGVRSPGCLLSRMYVSMTLMPNTQRRPTRLIKRKPSAKPSACLPAHSEKRPATRTLGFSRKIAPLRQSRCLSCSESLASPKQAQLRSAPCKSALERLAPHRLASQTLAWLKLAPRRSPFIRLIPRKS